MNPARQIAHDVFMLMQKRLMFNTYVDCPHVFHSVAESRIEMHAKSVEFAQPRGTSVGYFEVAYDAKEDSLIIQGIFSNRKKEWLRERVYLTFKGAIIEENNEKILASITSKLSAYMRRCYVTGYNTFIDALESEGNSESA